MLSDKLNFHMTFRLRSALIVFLFATTAFLAQNAKADFCVGINGGGTGGGCGEYSGTPACTAAVCELSTAPALIPGCDPNVGDCTDTTKLCSCTCYPDKAACDTARSTAAASAPIKIEPLKDPLGGANVRTLAARGVQLITGLAGSVALLMFVWGGFLWITSAGSAEKAKLAKKVFVNATLGLALIFGAYAIISTLLNAFSGLA